MKLAPGLCTPLPSHAPQPLPVQTNQRGIWIWGQLWEVGERPAKEGDKITETSPPEWGEDAKRRHHLRILGSLQGQILPQTAGNTQFYSSPPSKSIIATR